MEAVQRYGWKDVKSIAQHVGTRTPTQVRTHAQKLFLRQQKESTGIMAPAKNGRSEGLPPIPMPDGGDAGSSGAGASGEGLAGAPSSAEMQALPDMGDASGSGDGGYDIGGLGDPSSLSAADLSNPDAAPAGEPAVGDASMPPAGGE